MHRTKKISVPPDNRTELIEAGYRPDRTGPDLILNYKRCQTVFRLGNDYNEKQSERLFQNCWEIILFLLKSKCVNFQKIKILAFSNSLIRDMRSVAKIFVRPDSIKSQTEYRTGHFSEIRPDTGPDIFPKFG